MDILERVVGPLEPGDFNGDDGVVVRVVEGAVAADALGVGPLETQIGAHLECLLTLCVLKY